MNTYFYVKHVLVIVLILGLFQTDLNGQIDASWTDTVEVTNSRMPQKISETGRNITVINSTEIELLPATSLDDLLQYIPGIEVQSRNAFGAQGDISMRGSTYTQVLVLVDGMKLNDPLTAHFNSYIPVTLAEIERIEVIRGAAASMYGADAVGGVINIITKAFSNTTSSDTEVSGTFNLGEHRLVKANQGFFTSKGKLKISGGFDIAQSDGQQIDYDPSLGLESFNNFFDIKTVGAAVGYQINDQWGINARMAYDDRDFSARYFYTNSTFDKSVETVRNWWNQLQVNNIGEKSSTRFNVAYKNNTDKFVFSPDFPSTNNHVSQLLNFNVNHLRTINDRFSLNVGAEADNRKIESTDRGDHQDFHFGIYAIGAFEPSDNLHLTASLRLDNDANYGTEFSPQLNLSYILPKVTLRGSTGRSIRAADYTERYVSFNLANLTPGRSLGNANLAAEESWSHEITTGFLRSSKNLIDYVPTNYTDIPFNENLVVGADYNYASNVTDVKTIGLEVILNYRKQVSEKVRLNAQLGYTTIETSNEEDVISTYISSHAGSLIQTNLVLSIGGWDLGINGFSKNRTGRTAASVDGTLADSYSVWNVNTTVNLTEGFGLNLQVHNLFNASYQDILGAPMPSQWAMAGIKFRL